MRFFSVLKKKKLLVFAYNALKHKVILICIFLYKPHIWEFFFLELLMEGVSMDHIAGFFDEMLVTGKVQIKVSNCCQKGSDE